ncbi:MAG: hypothetical protein WBL62_06885 [Gallionella sp.]
MLKLFNPYVALAAVLYGLWVFGTGYFLGTKHEHEAGLARAPAVQAIQVAKAAQEDTRREAIGAAREQSREQIRTIYTTIREQADARSNTIQVDSNGVVVPSCGLDADGLRLWNAANSGTAAPLPSQPVSGVPRAAARAVGDVGRLAGQPYRGDGAGGAVSRSVSEAGSVFNPTEGSAP